MDRLSASGCSTVSGPGAARAGRAARRRGRARHPPVVRRRHDLRGRRAPARRGAGSGGSSARSWSRAARRWCRSRSPRCRCGSTPTRCCTPTATPGPRRPTPAPTPRQPHLMRAVARHRVRPRRPTLRRGARPGLPGDGVVVEVEATGLCRSDWHGWQGHDDGIALPHVPGHELAGTVAAVGAQVRRWAVGDRVTTPFVLACGACASCARGDGQVCERQLQPGFTQWGSFAEQVALPRADVNLVRVPDGVGADVAAGLGCRFATAYRAVAHVAARAGRRDGRRARLRRSRAGRGDGGASPGAPRWSRSTRRSRSRALAPTWAPRPSTPGDGRRPCRGRRLARLLRQPRRPWPRRSPACGRAVGTCRWGCSAAPTPARPSTWGGWSASSCSCSAATAWRPPLPRAARAGRRRHPRPAAAAARRIGLDEAPAQARRPRRARRRSRRGHRHPTRPR